MNQFKTNILALLILFLSTSFTTAQDNLTIEQAITGLSKEDTRYESMVELYRYNSDEPEKVKKYKKEISKALNPILQKEDTEFELYFLAFDLIYVDNISLDPATESKIVGKHKKIREALKQDDDYNDWIWEDSVYMERRYESGVLLDMMGYFKGKGSKAELSNSVSGFKDGRLKLFAALSLVRRNEKVDATEFQLIAADDAVRNMLYDGLEELNKINLFPKKFLNQEDLARSSMVKWLVYPTELGKMPNEIELLEVKTIQYSDVGNADHYLWKFKSNDEYFKDKGWMFGMSGPYIENELPTTNAQDYTFSAFEKLEEKSVDEHFNFIINLIDENYTSPAESDTIIIPLVSYWSVGDTYKYSIKKEKKKWKQGTLTEVDTSSFEASFSVIDSTATRYRIKWVYETDLEGDFSIPEEMLSKFAKYELNEVIYATSEVGDFIEIENWKEIADIMSSMFDDMVEVMGEGDDKLKKDLAKTIEPLRVAYSSKFGIEQIVMKELHYLHFPFGIEYVYGDTATYQDELPNMFGGDPIKGDVKLYIENIDTDNGLFTLKQEMDLNESGTKKMLLDFFKEIGRKDMDVEKLMKESEISITDRNRYELYYGPGVPNKIEVLRETLMNFEGESGRTTERLQMRLIRE